MKQELSPHSESDCAEIETKLFFCKRIFPTQAKSAEDEYLYFPHAPPLLICTLNSLLTLYIGEYYRKTREFHVKFHVKSRYHTNCEAMSAISIFVKFNAKFTSQVVHFP